MENKGDDDLENVLCSALVSPAQFSGLYIIADMVPELHLKDPVLSQPVSTVLLSLTRC